MIRHLLLALTAAFAPGRANGEALASNAPSYVTGAPILAGQFSDPEGNFLLSAVRYVVASQTSEFEVTQIAFGLARDFGPLRVGAQGDYIAMPWELGGSQASYRGELSLALLENLSVFGLAGRSQTQIDGNLDGWSLGARLWVERFETSLSYQMITTDPEEDFLWLTVRGSF